MIGADFRTGSYVFGDYALFVGAFWWSKDYCYKSMEIYLDSSSLFKEG